MVNALVTSCVLFGAFIVYSIVLNSDGLRCVVIGYVEKCCAQLRCVGFHLLHNI